MTRKIARIAAQLILAAAILWSLVNRERFDVDVLADWIAAFGVLAPVVFFFVRMAGAVVLIPGSVMAIAAGVLFGVAAGAAYNLVASTAGAVLAFAVARYIAPAWIEQRLSGGGLLARLVVGVEAEGWRFVAFVRLVPLFPYNVVNYALGLTRIKVSHYTLATLICMIPGDLAYVYMGYAAREALAGNKRTWQLGLVALGILASLAFVPRLVRRWRRAKASGG